MVSMVETKKCRLAKFLDNIIKPYISDTYLLKSTEHFLNKVKKFNFNKKRSGVGFYVVPLFTN